MRTITKEIKSTLKMLKRIERMKRKEGGATKSMKIKQQQTKFKLPQSNLK
jgi:hypothetical protein